MEQDNQSFENFIRKLKNSIVLKMVLIGFLALVLLIPTIFISQLIDERSIRRMEVISEVSGKWGGRQVISGPVLTVPVTIESFDKESEKMDYHRVNVHFIPEDLNISGQIDHELRKRSIYEVMLYETAIDVSGSFGKLNFENLGYKPHNIHWDEAIVSAGISDLTGIRERTFLQWGNEKMDFQAGLPNKDNFYQGIHARVETTPDQDFQFSYSLELRGSERLAFTPTGKTTHVTAESAWTEPSFDGHFLPAQRTIDSNGFSAEWNVIDLNRNIPDKWVGNSEELLASDFGVTMLVPVNEYQKNSRSSKYAILIISLTFLTFFLAEVIKKTILHPIQYGFAGLSLVVFYVLLLSISEHLGFDIAYLVSSVMTALLIVAYTSAIIRNRIFTIMLSTFFAIIYSFIYVILQLQDFALLVGALGLFAALAATMYLTRSIRW